MMIDSSSNLGITAANELRMVCNPINEQGLHLQKLNMEDGGQLTEIINGNRVIRMNKEGGTFAESAGDLRFNVDGCHYNKVGRNSFTEAKVV